MKYSIQISDPVGKLETIQAKYQNSNSSQWAPAIQLEEAVLDGVLDVVILEDLQPWGIK